MEKSDNELIAEFMGFTKIGVHESGAIIWGNVPGPIGHCVGEEFDTQWDWLMPVVEKIEAMGAVVEIWLSLGKGCRIYFVKERNEFTHESNSTIESVYTAVVEFIKWYNSHNKTT